MKSEEVTLRDRFAASNNPLAGGVAPLQQDNDSHLPTHDLTRFPFSIVHCEDEASWLRQRQRGIGASEGGAVLGLSRWADPLYVWADKTGLIAREALRANLLDMGHDLEPRNAAIFERETNMQAFDFGDYTIFRSNEIPYLQFTPDRIVTRYDMGKGVLELKYSPSGIKERPEYYVQVQHALAVTGYEWGCVSILDSFGMWEWFPYERNEAFIKRLLSVYEEFWYCVLTKTAPDVEPSPAVNETLKLIYAKDDGTHTLLPEEAKDWDAEYMQLGEDLKEANARAEEIKAKRQAIESNFRKALGKSKTGECGEVVYELKTVEVKPEPYAYRRLYRRAKKGEHT